MPVAARLFDGKTAKAEPVLLTLAEGRLFIASEDGQPLGDWPLDELRDENRPKLESEIKLSLDHQDVRLVITDIAFVEQLRQLCPALQKRRSAPAGWWRPYAYWGGGAVLSVVIMFTVVLPLLAGQVARLLPMETRQQIGSESRDFIVQSIARKRNTTPEAITCKNPEAELVLQKLVTQLQDGGVMDNAVSDITVVRTRQANAFALPGGQLIIFSGLLDLADHPNGFAGVLAHEIAHAAHNHPTRLFVTNVGVATVFSLLLGDVTGGTFLAALGQMTIGSGYSRDFEREADRSAIERMQGAGFDISPMADLMQKLAEQKGSESFLPFLDSHPGFDERIANLTAAGNSGGAALSETEWAQIQGFCK
ncbi:MAG: M48 family metallopeptidase [Sneathiella sp.]